MLKEANLKASMWDNIDRFFMRLHGKRRYVYIFAIMAVLAFFSWFFFFSNSALSRAHPGISVSLATLFLVALLTLAAILILEIIRITSKSTYKGPTQRRLILLFTMMALVPTVFVAIFSTLSLNLGFESWFSSRVKSVVESSYETAQTYSREHTQNILEDGEIIYQSLAQNASKNPQRDDDILITWLREAASAASPEVQHAFIFSVDSDNKIILHARGANSYLFNFYYPSTQILENTIGDEISLSEDWKRNEIRYLRHMPKLGQSYFLYLAHPVDGQILSLLDQSEKTAKFYKESENERRYMLSLYGVIYFLLGLFILLFAVWAALFLSKRLTRPIDNLLKAVERLSKGDFEARAKIMRTNDEFDILAKAFNQMTEEIQKGQDDIKRAGELAESGRKRFDNVLAGVSSGVIGIDKHMNLTFINPAATRILHTTPSRTKLDEIAPEFVTLVEEINQTGETGLQSQVTLIRERVQETLFVRISRQEQGLGSEYIISFDDVTNLVHAQKLAAWGDVARRIAHEIKNPLTPIRLSAERLLHRFVPAQPEDQEKFQGLVQVIIRQTEDLRRIVDEFSRFSRLPEPIIVEDDWIKTLEQTITLFSTNQSEVVFTTNLLEASPGLFDPTLIGQAFTNLIKNAVEAIDEKRKRLPPNTHDFLGAIEITTIKEDTNLLITIIDNGHGFPENKMKLFEPYVTSKTTGTGLGLPIVRKIIEDHGGRLTLHDREDGLQGALIKILVPLRFEQDLQKTPKGQNLTFEKS